MKNSTHQSCSMHYLEFQESHQSTPTRFWEITIENCTYHIREGAIATFGKRHSQTFTDAQICADKAQQQLQNQLSKGYYEVNLDMPEIGENWQEIAITQFKRLHLNPKRKEVLESAAIGILPEFLLKTLELELRIAIAKQSTTAPVILDQLASDNHETVRKAIAANSNTATATLEKLAIDRVLEVRMAVVKNPKASAHALNILADDVYEKVRKAVLRHPNLSGDALFKLRKIIPTYNLESQLSKAAQNSSTSVEILKQMAQQQEWRVRAGVAKNPNVPIELLAELAMDSVGYVRQAVAEHPKTPPEVLFKMLLGREPEPHPILSDRIGLHRNAINNADLIIAPLIDANNVDVQVKIASNPNLPIEAIQVFIQSIKQVIRTPYGEDLIAAIAAHPKTSVEILEWLSGEDYQQIFLDIYYKKLIKNYAKGSLDLSTPDGMNRYQQNVKELEKPDFRAYSDECAIPLLYEIYWGIAQNPNVPSDLYSRLLLQITAPVQNKSRLVAQNVMYGIANSQKTPVEILERLADYNPYAHEYIARNPNTPSHLLLRLANSERTDARLAVAQNSKTPVDALVQFANEKIWQHHINGQPPRSPLHEAVACHPNTPIEILTELAQNPHELIRAGVASNLSTPDALLTELAKDPATTHRYLNWNEMYYEVRYYHHPHSNTKEIAIVRFAVAQNPKTPIELLKQLAKDSDSQVQQTAKARLAKPKPLDTPLEPQFALTEEFLHKALQSKQPFKRLIALFAIGQNLVIESFMPWWERFAIALNPNTSPEVLHQLSNDSNRLVQAAAKNTD